MSQTLSFSKSTPCIEQHIANWKGIVSSHTTKSICMLDHMVPLKCVFEKEIMYKCMFASIHDRKPKSPWMEATSLSLCFCLPWFCIRWCFFQRIQTWLKYEIIMKIEAAVASWYDGAFISEFQNCCSGSVFLSSQSILNSTSYSEEASFQNWFWFENQL